MESQYKKVASVVELEKLSPGMSIMDIVFSDGTIAKYVSSYSSALDFLNKDVVVEFREDLYRGAPTQFISQLTITSVVSTLDREKDFKLYTEETGEIFSTVSFNDITETGLMGVILFCTNVKLEKSDKATWFKFTCMDRDRKVCNVRLFDPIRDTANFINRYVRMDVRKGNIDFIARKISIEQGRAPEPNPEIKVAKTFISYLIEDFPSVKALVEDSDILNFIEHYNIDEEIEPGYEMVRLAIELEQIRNLKNVTKDVDVEAMMKKCIVDRGYCITNSDTTVKSKEFQNMEFALKNGAVTSKMDMHLVDTTTHLNTAEINLIRNFRSIATTIAKANRTYFYDRIK